MNYFLLNLKVNGIKNIEKEIEIDFYKKDLKNFSPINYNIKGIFWSKWNRKNSYF